MLHIAFALLILPGSAPIEASAQVPDTRPQIEVTAPKDAANVRALNEALDTLIDKVVDCPAPGPARDACVCKQQDLIGKLRAAHAQVLKDHPEWKDRQLSYKYEGKDGKPMSGVMVMPTMQRQIDRLTCK